MNLTAVILAGGLGTRLRSLIEDRPKVLAPVAGRPFVFYLLDQLADAGVREVVLCTGHLGDQVRDALGSHYRLLRLRYAQECKPLGTAGAARNALELIHTSHALLLNGDSYCDFNLRDLISDHQRENLSMSMVLTEVEDASRFGTVSCDGRRRVEKFEEKNSAHRGLVSAGIYLLPRELIAQILEGVSLSIERDYFPKWVGDGILGFYGGKRFLDIGTPHSYATAQTFFAPDGVAKGQYTPRRCVFLDRDGTVNVERHYLSGPDELELLPHAAAGMRCLRKLGFGLVLITNQSAVGRGLFDEKQLRLIHDRLREMIGEHDIGFDAIYYCPHTPDEGCECRKPRTGLMSRAIHELGIAPQDAVVIGDKRCDVEFGRNVGATTILVRTGYGREAEQAPVLADYVTDDLMTAADQLEHAHAARAVAGG